MFSFQSDYCEGAHPRILKALTETNLEQTEGYGLDIYTEKAASLIKNKLKNKDVDIHFLTGGTQTNLIALSAFLRPHEAAISADTGHIEVHETGAIEATGHKVVTIAVPDGKLTPACLQPVVDAHSDEHMVKPRLVYISDTTEVGTAYTKKELIQLSRYCRQNGLLLYVDGARLGSALCLKGNDLTLADLSELTDAFYIGGTKNGALFGEALVICNPALRADFRYHMKQRGGLLAKGRVLGIQFCELFRDDLYFELAAHANHMSDLLREGIQNAGYAFLSASRSNQLFPIFPDTLIQKLNKNYSFIVISKLDAGSSCVRLVTSWATSMEAVTAFIDDINTFPKRGSRARV